MPRNRREGEDCCLRFEVAWSMSIDLTFCHRFALHKPLILRWNLPRIIFLPILSVKILLCELYLDEVQLMDYEFGRSKFADFIAANVIFVVLILLDRQFLLLVINIYCQNSSCIILVLHLILQAFFLWI